MLGALVFGVRISRRVVIGGALGVIGVAAMFYPELGGLEFNGTSMLGLAFALGGTYRSASATWCRWRHSGRKLRSLPRPGKGHGLRHEPSSALPALARGRTFTVEWTVTYLGGLAYLSVVASVCRLQRLFHAARPHRRGAHRLGTTVMYPVVALS